MLPRFRGRAYEVTNGWAWECFVNVLGDNDNGFSFCSNDIFASKADAIIDLKKAIKVACDDLQEKFMGASNGEYIDMKTNEKLKWNKEEHH